MGSSCFCGCCAKRVREKVETAAGDRMKWTEKKCNRKKEANTQSGIHSPIFCQNVASFKLSRPLILKLCLKWSRVDG